MNPPAKVRRRYGVYLTGDTYGARGAAKAEGFKWTGSGWLRWFGSAEQAEEKRTEWAEEDGIRVAVRVRERMVYRPDPPPWSVLVALRRCPVRWYLDDLAEHLSALGSDIPEPETKGITTHEWSYTHEWLDEDLREGRVPDKPTEVTDLASFLAFADEPVYRPGRAGKSAREIERQVERTEEEIRRLRGRANNLVRSRRNLLKRLRDRG